MNEFATLAFILSFPGMVLTVSMLTQVTKRLVDRVFKMETQYLVYIYSLALCIVAALVKGDFGTLSAGAETALVWFVNSAIVWLASMKAFEKIKEPTDGSIDIEEQEDKSIWNIKFNEDMPIFKDGKVVKLKVNVKEEKRLKA